MLKFSTKNRQNTCYQSKGEKSIFHATHVDMSAYSFRTGFTLAEVLITLGVIGVVAAITLPTVVANITEKMNNEREKNIVQKITKSMEQMRALGLLNQTYDSTEGFVDDLQKHLKIAKRCDKDHIAECWPTQTVINGDGNEVEVKTAKKGKNIKLSTNTNNVGLILADGASIILNYDPSKGSIDVGDEVKTSDDGYTTSVTKNIAFIMDVNGGKSPNSEVSTKKRDVRSFNGARFAGCPGKKLDGVCYYVIANFSPVSCKPDSKYFNTSFCGNIKSHLEDDYWAGAKVACDNEGMKDANPSTLYENGTLSKLGYESGLYWTKSEGTGNGFLWQKNLGGRAYPKSFAYGQALCYE